MEGGGAVAAEFLLKTLIDVTKGEISLIRGLKNEAHELQNSLTLIHSYLDDADKKLITDEAVKTWSKQLEDVGFDAYDVLDELNYHLLSTKMKKIRREKKLTAILGCFPSFKGYVRRRSVALRINKVCLSFDSIKDNATKLGLDSRPAIAYALPEETNSFTLDPIFIGRDDDVSGVIRKMLTTEEPLSVLPIVGMGGLGKTTLARKVFNHEQIKTRFGKRIWIHVSKNFDVVVLLKNILANLTSADVVDESEMVLLKKIQENLAGKTYLLVLDDVWNEDGQVWEGFQNSLAGITSTKRNFILVTTRSKQVASIVTTFDICNLNVLSDEDCLSIIKKKVVSDEEDIPSRFESVVNNIVRRCQGLPLAAKVVGGLLHRTSKDEWISIAQNWLSRLQVDDNDVSKILKLSFDHLSPTSLKKCFAYCSYFPKGQVIDTRDLIELWMAQGFLRIDSEYEYGMEVEGNKFLNFLVQNSLLQVAEQDEYGNITHCSMHDLVHDLACIVSKGVYQVQYIGSKNDGGGSISIRQECWRTLFINAEVFSCSMFLDYKSLHTLTIMDHHVTELPSSISELIHLRYLNISSTRIQNLPDSIGDLYHLQTLRAECCLSKLPSTVQYLINLRHLHLLSLAELPPNIGRLTSLQTLAYYHVGKEEGHRIGELGRLKNLQGNLHISNLENVHHQEEAESAHLFKKPKIIKLSLQWNSIGGGGNEGNVFEGLRPHPNLKMLEIIGFKGTRFPSWTSNLAEGLNNLMEVSLEDCHECEEIPMMGHLPHLKSLSLSNLRNVRSIRSSFKDHNCKETIVVFPVLKRLELSELPNLVEWLEIELPENHPLEVKVFPCLEHLEIYECRQLRIDRTQIQSTTSICGSLTQLKISGVDGSKCLPDWCLNNESLTKLDILSCGKLKELPDGLHNLNSLKELNIRHCPNLMSIPHRSNRESQSLTSLEWLSITHCQGLISLPFEMLESCALSLQRLELRNLSSMINLPTTIECLSKMPLLRSLTITQVPKLVMNPSFFHNLERLCINPAASDSSDSAKQVVDAMLQAASQSLHHLTLTVMEDWDSLPRSLQHLKALSFLELFDSRIEELPEWFENLTSLQRLHLHEFKELRSVEAMRGLKKLTELSITNCHPILKSSIEQHTSDDVSHIANIWIDRKPVPHEV